MSDFENTYNAAAAIMPLDLWAVFATLILGMVHIGLSSILSLAQLGPSYILSPRDEQRDPTGIAGRIARAYRNFLENFAQFLAAIFIVHMSATNGDYSVVGAWMFFAGRLMYIPAYAIGPSGLRPACWMFSHFGTLIILADIFM